MREIEAVCQPRAPRNVKRVLDAWLTREKPLVWRGMASNRALQHMADELSALEMGRVHVSVRSGGAALFTVGRGKAGAERSQAPARGAFRAAIRIAALFHDLGKATVLFQNKLNAALRGGDPQADALRHELISALAWDEICATRPDADLKATLLALTAADIDRAMSGAAARAAELWRRGSVAPEAFSYRPVFFDAGACGKAIGLLILGHHRLPALDDAHHEILLTQHARFDTASKPDDFKVAPGTPFWHDPGFLAALAREAAQLGEMEAELALMDLYGRSALMMADHYGSSRKEPHKSGDHLANTMPGKNGGFIRADSLDQHVTRVSDAVRGSFDALVTARDAYPAIPIGDIPATIARPAFEGRFGWQGQAAARAREIAASGDGGFFACLMAGTGSGKTRAAPGILAAALSGDTRAAKGGLRFTLGLGLRTLATQSGAEYVESMGFSSRDVGVMVGSAPIIFPKASDPDEGDASGSGNMLDGFSSFDILPAEGRVPEPGSAEEDGWLAGLSHDPGRVPPSFISAMAEATRDDKIARLAATPILCMTVDHIISAASAERSRHLGGAMRIITSDLVLDEVDQYGAEDLAVVARLSWLTGAAGRRLIIMSATVTREIAQALYEAYAAGWKAHAAAFGRSAAVRHLCTGDTEGALSSSLEGCGFGESFDLTAGRMAAALAAGTARRVCEILPVVPIGAITAQVSAHCGLMHDRHACEIDDLRVSVGMVRMTRISHTVSLAAHLPQVPGRLRRIVCLHSRMAPLLRAAIESQLREALTRKGADPDAGLRRWLKRLGVFEAARAEGLRDVEILVVCSPVIETGNDLDFDYGMIDPSSTRAIVQAAGRVLRHRDLAPRAANVALLGRPLVTYDKGSDGLLSMPGLETRPPADARVSAVRLKVARETAPLMGEIDRMRIDARMINGATVGPMAAGEAELVRRFLSEGQLRAEVWAQEPTLRHAINFARKRRFRRQTTRDLLAWRAGETKDLRWYWDRLPGRRDPVTEKACLDQAPALALALLSQPLPDALAALGIGDEIGPHRGRRLLGIRWPIYEGADDPKVAYSDDLGLFAVKGFGLLAPESEGNV